MRSPSPTAFTLFMCYLIGVIVYSFDPVMQSFPSILIDDFMRAFATTAIGVGFIASSYFYSYNLLQIPAGLLCDKLGVKWVLILSSCICLLALALFSQVHSLAAAIGCRILMGLGASCAAVIMILICKAYFSARWLPVLIGIAQFACNVGALSGQYPLTFLAADVGWRAAILSLSLLPMLLIAATFIFLRQTKPSAPKREYLSEIKTVFSNKRNWLIGTYAMLLWTPFYTFASLWGIPFLREKLGVDVTEASRLIAIAWIGSGVGSILLGLLSSYLQKRKLSMMLSSLMGIMIFPFLIWLPIQDNALLSVILFLFGVASSGQALSFALVDDNNHASVLGTASGFNNTVIMIGPMLSDPIVGGLLKYNWDGSLQNGIPYYSVANFELAFILIPILFAASLLVSFLYREKTSSSSPAISELDLGLLEESLERA